MPKTDETRAITSCVMRGGGEEIKPKIDRHILGMLDILQEHEEGLRHGQWKSKTVDKKVCSASSFNRKIKTIIRNSMVTKPAYDDPMHDLGHIYQLTLDGEAHIAQNRP